MSWWVGMDVDTGGPETATISDRNVTYNYSPLFYRVLNLPEGLRSLHGFTGMEAAAHLTVALDRLRYLPPDEQMSLVRGDGSWGTPEGAREALEWLLAQAQAHPHATVYIH